MYLRPCNIPPKCVLHMCNRASPRLFFLFMYFVWYYIALKHTIQCYALHVLLARQERFSSMEFDEFYLRIFIRATEMTLIKKAYNYKPN